VLEPRLEAVDEGQRVGGGAGEARQHLGVVQALDLARALLDDRLPVRHLAVAGEGHLPLVADGEDGGAVEGSGVPHGCLPQLWPERLV